MLLKSIDLQGYKTFAGKTTFEFAGAITCIVGPNGSGKSNIADAIRWVLGEQSYRLLRGRKTEDMIFSGSDARSRAGMASANIVFDNSTGWLPIDFSEVSIARRAYRDGTNEYLLNGQRVRLRDITELLASSGLSERTYTIIGQGLVDAALSLRADERRDLFEEAAGIGLYRSRREEALRRLETTFHNLERVEDILSELKPRLRSLERQARKAAQYEQVATDLKELLRDYYGYHWYQGQLELTQARESARVQKDVYQAVQMEQTGLENQIDQIREKVQGLRSKLGSWHRESSQLHLQREEITRDLAVSEERHRSLIAQKQNVQDEITRLDQLINLYSEQKLEADESVRLLKADLSEAQSRLQEARQGLDTRKNEYKLAEAKSDKLRSTLEVLSNQENKLQARLSERHDQIDRLRATLDAANQGIQAAEKEIKHAKEELEEAQATLQKRAYLRSQAENALQVQIQSRLEKETDRRKLLDKRSKLEAEFARISAQVSVLEDAERVFSGYSNGTKLLMNAAKEGKISRIQGALGSKLDVPQEFEIAISAALGEYLDAVLLDADSNPGEDTTIQMALDLLLDNNAYGILLPKEKIHPTTRYDPPLGEGIMGIAADLIECQENLRPVVEAILGGTLVVRDRRVVDKVLQGDPPFMQVVTLSGEVYHRIGSVSTGAVRRHRTLSRPRQKRELQVQITTYQNRVADLDQTIDRLESQISQQLIQEQGLQEEVNQVVQGEKAAISAQNDAELEAETRSSELTWRREQREKTKAELEEIRAEINTHNQSLGQLKIEISQIREDQRKINHQLASLSLSDFQEQVNVWHTQLAVINTDLKSAQTRLDEREAILTDAFDNKKKLGARITSFDRSMKELDDYMKEIRKRESEVIRKIETLRSKISPAEAELSQADAKRSELMEAEVKARRGLTTAYRLHSQAQLTFTRKQEQLDNLRERIENDLGLVSFEYDAEISGPTPLPIGGMVESLPRLKELPQGMEKTLQRQRTQVRRMGSVNPEAQSEYKQVKERFDFMTAQIEDLQKAERDIKQVIAELEAIMQREFRITFDKVAAEFRETFTRLFGGGSARLLLTDPDDLTQTGIDIEARLPGRKTQGLSLLSGGERSLTAAALVFSLLKVSPTPFCVLDEVDAMLDEANVGRFRDLLRELSENTQFIVITHNRNTVQAADVIYGVTMGRDSVSQMISLRLDEVAEVV